LYLAANTSHWILDKNAKWIRQNIDRDGNVLQDVQEQLIKRKNLRGLD
jgi:hypothetical protein